MFIVSVSLALQGAINMVEPDTVPSLKVTVPSEDPPAMMYPTNPIVTGKQ